MPAPQIRPTILALYKCMYVCISAFSLFSFIVFMNKTYDDNNNSIKQIDSHAQSSGDNKETATYAA